jgi:hypothetical protein
VAAVRFECGIDTERLKWAGKILQDSPFLGNTSAVYSWIMRMERVIEGVFDWRLARAMRIP